MTWDKFKKWLYDRNRTTELCNKGTGSEVLTLWNDIMAAEYMEPYKFINILYRSGRPRVITKKVLVSPPKNIYDYGKYKNEVVGFEYPPKRKNNQFELML